jgi:N-acyl-D-amino-acid deacylase
MFKGDVGVSDNKIVKIGKIEDQGAVRTIDAKGLMVSQGVTTEMNGLCGYACAPIDQDEWWKLLYVRMTVGWSMHYTAAAYNSWPLPYGKQIDVDWSSMKEFLDRVEETGIGLNFAMLFGHGAIRYYVMGLEARLAEQYEIEEMKAMADKTMREGALGMSSGLSGCPGCWAGPDELTEICKVVAKYDGVYMPHQRSSREEIHIQESIEVAEKSGCRTVLSHTRLNPVTQKLLDDKRAEGLDITFDYFPYPGSIAGNIVYMLPHWLSRHREKGFNYVIEQLKDPSVRKKFAEEDYPKWILQRFSIPGSYEHQFGKGKEGGISLQQGSSAVPSWDYMQLQKVWSRKNRKYIGLTFAEIAEARGVDPWTAWFDIIVDENGYARWLNLYTDDLEDMYNPEFEAQLKVPYGCIESDGPMMSPRGVTVSSVDPRSYGTFPLVLEEYVRKRKVLSWEEAIKRMTSNPAKVMGLTDRGQLKEGFWADLVVFDPETIASKANFKNALEMSQGINHDLYPEGIKQVIVNGEIAVEKGKLQGKTSGHVLRHNK